MDRSGPVSDINLEFRDVNLNCWILQYLLLHCFNRFNKSLIHFTDRYNAVVSLPALLFQQISPVFKRTQLEQMAANTLDYDKNH